MAPRANWKGYLRLSLVSCPIALYPASTATQRVHFHQINVKTGHRIKLHRVDAETGDEVPYEDIVKGYQLDEERYVTLEPEELEAIAVESTRTIDIDSFVRREEIDDLYIGDPYYIAPEGEVGAQAFAVIRDVIAKKEMVALGRVVLSTREHVIALEARGKGLFGMTLRYPYEVREDDAYFGDIPDEKVTKDMVDLALHIVDAKTQKFAPEQFEDRYETALRELIEKKAAGVAIKPAKQRESAQVIDLMEALRRSVNEDGRRKPRAPSAHRRRQTHRTHRRRPAAKHRRAG
ncbi:MAG: Ku protein [Acetobacteraceae bacterium]|nr:Ku protein [Acetobacteraceae bacterium]